MKQDVTQESRALWWVQRGLVVLAASCTYATFAAPAHACETAQICASWTQVPNDDAPFGDLVTGEEYPARGARMRVIRPYPEPALEMFLDENGCGSFDTQFAAGHKALLFSEAVLGIGTGGLVHIKTYESEAQKDDDTDSFVAVDVPSIPEDWTVTVTAPADAEHRIELLATATEVVHRLHGLDGSLIVGSHTLQIWVDPMAQNASAPLGGVRVGSAGDEQGISALRKKFILGHEIGHWIQSEIVGDVWAYNYGYGPDLNSEPLDPIVPGNPLDEPCRWAVETLLDEGLANQNRHGLRSAEFVSGAMPEGFGHFVASVAFNSDLGADADGEFRYYKDPDELLLPSYADFEDDNRIASLRGGSGSTVSGGPDRWVELQCTTDWAHPLQQATLDQEVSSEIDWLRLFWRFVTAPYTPQAAAPTFWDVVRLVTFTQEEYPWDSSDHVLWPNMQAAINDVDSDIDEYAQRFEGLSADHGVYNDGP